METCIVKMANAAKSLIHQEVQLPEWYPPFTEWIAGRIEGRIKKR